MIAQETQKLSGGKILSHNALASLKPSPHPQTHQLLVRKLSKRKPNSSYTFTFCSSWIFFVWKIQRDRPWVVSPTVNWWKTHLTVICCAKLERKYLTANKEDMSWPTSVTVAISWWQVTANKHFYANRMPCFSCIYFYCYIIKKKCFENDCNKVFHVTYSKDSHASWFHMTKAITSVVDYPIKGQCKIFFVPPTRDLTKTKWTLNSWLEMKLTWASQ